MSKKICKKCEEINSGSAMYCSNCHSSLRDAEVREDVNEPISFGRRNSTSAVYTGNPNVVTLGEWMIILIILAIPFVNIIALIVMAFVWDNDNINNFGKASLILALIGIVIIILFRGCRAF